jgi:hypothetical protein
MPHPKFRLAIDLNLAFEAGAKLRSRQEVSNARSDAATDVDAAPGTEHQRGASGDRSQHGTELLKRLPCDWANACERCLCYFRGVARRRIDPIERDNRTIEVL